jgi:hypothetical protein
VEEERKAEGFAVDARDYDFRGRVFGEECSAKFFFGGNAGIAKLFISREALDELQNERDVVLSRFSYFNRIRQSPGPR